MIDDALCANPATRGGASTGHNENAADPAGGRRRLTANSFRALTLRLKTSAPLTPASPPIRPAPSPPSAPPNADASTPAPVPPTPADLSITTALDTILKAPSVVPAEGAEEAEPAVRQGESLAGDDPDRFIELLRGASDEPEADAEDEDHAAIAASEPGAPDLPSPADLPAPAFTDEIGEVQPVDASGLSREAEPIAPDSPSAGVREDDRFIELLRGVPDEAESETGDEDHSVSAAEEPKVPGLADESDNVSSEVADDGLHDVDPAASDRTGDGDTAVAQLPETAGNDEVAVSVAAPDELPAVAGVPPAAGSSDDDEEASGQEGRSDADALEAIRASVFDSLASEAGKGEPVAPLTDDGAAAPLQNILRQLEAHFGSSASADRDDLDAASVPTDNADVSAGDQCFPNLDAIDDGEGHPASGDAEPPPLTVQTEEPHAGESAVDEGPAHVEASALPREDTPGDTDLSAMPGDPGDSLATDGQAIEADDIQLPGSADAFGGIEALEAFDAALPIDEASGETARMLLDIMSMPASALQPQERGLAADTLLRLIARMPAKAVMALAERFCMMDTPPGLIIKELIGHPNEEVAALVLEKCANVTDQDLLDLIAHASLSKLRMVARRREVSSALVDALISRGDASVYLTIVRNPGADISYDAFIELCELAKSQPNLQAPLATRANTPAPVAFELFWFLPSELRRYVLSRFLTDSETLTKILKITLAVDSAAGCEVTERQFPPRARIEELVGLIEEGLTPEASRLMASLSGICEACARRLIADPDGEPLTIVMKAMGATRALFAAAMERWQTSTSAMLRADRNLDELRNLFDSLSFNKARVLLTYWDWAARKAGPYARRAA